MENIVKRKEMVDRLSQKGYTKKDANIIIADVFDMIAEALVEGKSVQVHGFGTFVIKEIGAKETTLVNSDERVVIPAYKSPRFAAGTLLKRAVKDGCMPE